MPGPECAVLGVMLAGIGLTAGRDPTMHPTGKQWARSVFAAGLGLLLGGTILIIFVDKPVQ